MTRARPRSRGFMLIEMMFALALLGVFALVATKLMVLSLTLPKQAADHHNQVLRFDSLVTRLREDVWSARKISAPDPRTLKLEFDDSPEVTWKVGDDWVQRAVEGTLLQDWRVDQKLSFAADSSSMTLSVREKMGAQGTIRIASQRIDLQEARR